MARNEILDMYKIINERGERDGGAYVFKVEHVTAWEIFRDNPTIDTARALLDVAPMLRDYFEGCCPGGNIYITNRLLNDPGPKG